MWFFNLPYVIIIYFVVAHVRKYSVVSNRYVFATHVLNQGRNYSVSTVSQS